MDWSILVGVGTIILAIATILYVNQSRLQTQILAKQINLQTGQQIPHLFTKEVEFREDAIQIEVQNATNVAAYWVGLETRFYIIKQELSSDKDGNDKINWGEAIKLKEQGKTIYSKYFWLGPNVPVLRYQNSIVKPDAATSFFSPQGVSVYFPPNTTIKIQSKPMFLISLESNQGLNSYQGFDFNEFREFLLDNNIGEAAVVMSLLSKDAAEIVHHQGNIASFIVGCLDCTL